LTEADLDFLVAAAAPEVRDQAGLRRLIRTDEDFRNSFLEEKSVLKKVLSDEEACLKISPRLYFEILLRQTRRELETTQYTVERTGTQKVAVFDAREVLDLLSRPEMLAYLAHMLSTFTRLESYSLAVRVGRGSWRKIRFNDLDIDSLICCSEWVEEDYRLGFFKRIADICLFILGLFPDFVRAQHRYPFSGELRPQLPGRARRTLTDYEEEGKRFYQLAAEHPAASSLKLSGIFELLYGRFHVAPKPLNFMAEHYLHYQRRHLFGVYLH
jgi:hypothetical protein